MSCVGLRHAYDLYVLITEHPSIALLVCFTECLNATATMDADIVEQHVDETVRAALLETVGRVFHEINIP